MALYNFPDSPSNADTVTINGITYTYNSTKGYWTSSAGSSGGGASVSTSDSAPSSPSDGDLWYDTDDGGMFVYYADGSSNQWVEVVGQQGATGSAGAAGADGSATVVANVTALMAISSPSAGDQAFVSGTNTLYFYNGSGWYKIALINTTPSISGANASYALASDGTATTVTIVATDPEGLPITYSIASDTSGNIATVAQGTGASTNVWTITPSTNTTYAGTFSLTFRASDGVNIAEAASSFTLEFKVVNSNYTSALITSIGANNATNKSTFSDSSSHTHAVAGVNNPHNTTLSPFRAGGYSTYFDGTGDYLKVTDSAEHNFGTGDFSMEFFWWPETLSGNTGNLHIMISAPNNSHNQFIYHESNYWYYQAGSAGATVIPSSTGAATAKAWNHVVLCRSGTTMSIFNNGTRTATVQSSAAVDFSHASIGRYDGGGYEIDGYVRDMRWLKGSSAYDATQTSITVPTAPLTAITNTKLLACQLPYIADSSTTKHTITPNGNIIPKPFGPYDETAYALADNGSSLRFDQANNDDYLSVTVDNATMDLGSAWTVECWFTHEAFVADAAIFQKGGGGGAWNGTNGVHYGFSFSANKINWIFQHSAGSYTYFGSTTNPRVKQWNHLAVSYDGTNTSLFLNGVRENTRTGANPVAPTTRDKFAIATGQVNGFSGADLKGNLTDFRISNVARYDPTQTTCTVPTAKFTSDSNTGLLLQGKDGGIIDKSQRAKSVSLVGNTKSSTTYTKFLSSSIYFDGSGDYINLDDQDLANFGDKPFTIEGWLYLVAYPSNWNFTLDTRSSGSDSNGFCIEVTPSDFGIYAGENMCRSGSGFGLGAWKHWAYTRDTSGNHKVFINGTQSGSTFTGSKNYTTNKLKIAAGHNGSDNQNAYMSDIRSTKGLARYTSNFTAPTAALEG